MVSLPFRMRTFWSRHLKPMRIFVSSFVGVILAGGVLLWFPFSGASGGLRFVDALFTSTSAVCVTGLVVVDTGKDLSLLGQVITLVLIQIGGLGIITFSTVFFVLMGRSIPFKEREIVQSTFLHTPRRDFTVIAKYVLLFAFTTELAGSLLLWLRFVWDFPPGRALYLAVYHAVSAFNNAGFSLFSDNLVTYQADALVNLTILMLIVHGGIGFIVQYELLAKWRGTQKRLSLHTKVVLVTTAILIVAGALFFYLFERNHTLKGLPAGTKLLISLFQSVTPRTAGFNTVEIGMLTNATILLLIVLMFVGASPGSTGGGVKTTSAAVLALLVWNRLRGNEQVEVWRRTVPFDILNRTVSIVFASVVSVALIWSILLIAGGGTLPPERTRSLFVEYLFETVSAFGTVGLSMGVTPTLNDLQKGFLILMMLAGRVGPLTLAFSLAREAGKRRWSYAEEGVMVG